jgi:uncharacterized membrane protein
MKNFIEKWLKEGLVTQAQAKQMSADIEKESSEKSSKKIILTFSLIGAALVGAGFLLFISANWQAIPSIIKVFLIAAVTFGCAFGGYYLEFENKKYPRTGASLLFLSAIMFGVLVFLTAQIYHIDSHRGTHLLVLIWLLGIMPYVYILQSRSVSALSCALFIIWLGAFLLKSNDGESALKFMTLIYSITALFIYAFGRANKFFKAGVKSSGVYEKFGIFIFCFCFFLMTFNYFANAYSFLVFDSSHNGESYPAVLRFIDIMLFSSVIMFLPSYFFNPAKSKANNEEGALAAFLICICVNFYGKNLIPYGFTRLFTNLFFAAMLLALIYTGYRKRETFYVNLGIFWLIVFILVKYFDFFWKLLPRSLFFLAGGILLVGAALLLENKRRKINTEFKTGQGESA